MTPPNPFLAPFPDLAPPAGWIARPAESQAVLGAVVRGGRLALVGRHGTGRRTLVEAALGRALALDARVIRTDATRMTSWLEVAVALATELLDAEGGLEDDARPTEHALKLYRSKLSIARVPGDGGAWSVELRRPVRLAAAAWPWVACSAVLEEIARRTAARHERTLVILEGVEALSDAPTGGRASGAAPGEELGRLLDEAVAPATGGGTFTLLVVAAGSEPACALGALAPALPAHVAVGALPEDAAAAWFASGCSKSGVSVGPEAVAAFLDAAGTAAHRVVSFAAACWEAARRGTEPAGGNPEVTRRIVETVATARQQATEIDYRTRWTALPLAQRVALRAVAARGGRELASQETMLETNLAVSSMQRALGSLVTKGILVRAADPARPGRERFRFEDPLFGRWVGAGG